MMIINQLKCQLECYIIMRSRLWSRVTLGPVPMSSPLPSWLVCRQKTRGLFFCFCLYRDLQEALIVWVYSPFKRMSSLDKESSHAQTNNSHGVEMWSNVRPIRFHTKIHTKTTTVFTFLWHWLLKKPQETLEYFRVILPLQHDRTNRSTQVLGTIVYIYIGLALWFCCHFQQKLQSNRAAAFVSTGPLAASTAGVNRCFNGRVACWEVKGIPGFLPDAEKKHLVWKSKHAHLGDCIVPDKETPAQPSHIFNSPPATGGDWLNRATCCPCSFLTSHFPALVVHGSPSISKTSRF